MQVVLYSDILQPMINVKVTRKGKEVSGTLLRAFSKKIQMAGILSTAKGSMELKRKKSKCVQRSQTIRRLKKRSRIEELYRLGKIQSLNTRKRKK